ncbi:MAG: hypothetical protein PHP00_15595 [Thiotrichaceae bacterium]|nr:hypothetical protein [Thiotrichaceae bacterium]
MPKLFFSMKDVRNDFSFLELAEPNHQLYLSFKDNECFSISTQIEGLILPDGYDIIRINNFVSDHEMMAKESAISLSNHPLADIQKSFPKKSQIALVSHLEEKVVYYNKLIINYDIALSCKPVTQVLLWRTSDPRYRNVVRGLAEKVFFDYLLNNYDIIFSDNYQSIYGQRFWETCLLQAIDDGLYTYMYEQMSAKLVRLTRELFESKKVEIWGDEEKFAWILAIISKSEITKT